MNYYDSTLLLHLCCGICRVPTSQIGEIYIYISKHMTQNVFYINHLFMLSATLNIFCYIYFIDPKQLRQLCMLCCA